MNIEISPDFPRVEASALAGAQPKLATIETAGRYLPGTESIEQVQAQYQMCEDLAHQMRDYCARKLSEGAVSSQSAALARGLEGLRSKGWCTQERNVWIINRAAMLLGWSPIDPVLSVRSAVPEIRKAFSVPGSPPNSSGRVLTDIERALATPQTSSRLVGRKA